MKNLLIRIGNYFALDNSKSIVFVDRAFLGLFAIFTVLRKNTGKSKVLFTSNTCASPVYACIYAGLTPIFTDISLNNFLMDADESIKTIHECKEELAAVVYIYTFGHTSQDIISIHNVTKTYGITLIEDVAQAFGSKVNGLHAGKVGDISVFSFGYSKQIDSGSGGFIINNHFRFENAEIKNIINNTDRFKENVSLSSDYKDQFYRLRTEALQDPNKFSSYSDFHSKYKTLYFRQLNPDWYSVDEKLRYFISSDQRSKRNNTAERYYESIIKSDLFSHVYAPLVLHEYSVYRYTILVKNFDISLRLSNHLRSNNINCSNLYLPISRYFCNYNYENAIDFSRRAINLWVDATADKEYVSRTLQLIRDFYKNYSNERHYED